ncbi:response regulator [candidate division KSB1 bacterium]|nr:response regulator [candidate division KSB1 bacterium]
MEKSDKKTILILDDTKPIRLLLLKRLEKKYNCILSSNPVDAIKFIKDFDDEIALIITDYQMPKLNGQEFLEKIQFKIRNIPVIMLSSSLNEIRIKDLYSLGVRIFIAKPVKINRLIREINLLIAEPESEENKDDDKKS